MAGKDSYQRLVELMQNEGLRSKVDSYILHSLAMSAEKGLDVDSLKTPMLVGLSNENVDLHQYAEVLSIIGPTAAIRVTCAQLIELVQLDTVQSLESSRPTAAMD